MINKVDISIAAYAERTAAAPARRRAGRTRRGPPQAARRAGGARPLQFPGAPAQRPHRPGADRRQRGRLQAEREDAGGRRVSGRAASTRPACPRAWSRCVQGGPETGKALAAHAGHRRPAVHRLGARRPRAPPPVRRDARTRSSRSRWAATIRSSSGTRKDVHAAAAIVVQSAFISAGQRCTAARRLIVKDGAARGR